MILGRPTNLIVGAFTALLNVVILVLATQGIVVEAQLVAAINIAAAAVITLVANQPPTLNPGDKVQVKTPNGDPNIVKTV